MIYEAQRWNGWLDHLQANTLGQGVTSRIRRLPFGQALDLYPEVRGFRHPWLTDVRWNVDRFEAQILPGLVNAIDPVVEGVKSEIEGQEKDDATLTEYPWIPLRSFRSGLSEESALTRVYFEALGVQEDIGDRIIINDLGGVTIAEKTAISELPPRQLVACDLYLAKARATFRAQVDVVDASGASGHAVDYSVTYDTTQLDMKGTRPRVLQAELFPPVRRPTLADRLMGNYQDEGEDRRNICSIYLLSPPDFEGPVDASWTPYARHDLFWNLKHGAPNTRPATPPKPIRFFSGLAGGFGDLLINQWLALDNSLAGQLLNAVNNTAPEGQFSIA